VVDGEGGPEEGLIAAATAGITDDDAADRLVAQGAVPAGGAAEDQRGHLRTGAGDGQRIAPPTRRRQRRGRGPAVPLATGTAARAGTPPPRPRPAGGLRTQAPEHLDVGGATGQEGAGRGGAVDHRVGGRRA